MKFLLTFIFVVIYGGICAQGFVSKQKKYARVRDAFKEKEGFVDSLFAEKGIINTYIAVRALKKERRFEIWAKNKSDTAYQHIITYDFCSSSGNLGPKRREGDLQIPEGFYHINHFNPYSNFHLSLGINYPNTSDDILSHPKSPGGNIYLHGACVTIGCIPITDDKIKEFYVMAVKAKGNGQKRIPVMIFPSKLNPFSWELLQEMYENRSDLLDLWENLKEGYEYFDNKRMMPKFTVDQEGRYLFE